MWTDSFSYSFKITTNAPTVVKECEPSGKNVGRMKIKAWRRDIIALCGGVGETL